MSKGLLELLRVVEILNLWIALSGAWVNAGAARRARATHKLMVDKNVNHGMQIWTKGMVRSRRAFFLIQVVILAVLFRRGSFVWFRPEVIKFPWDTLVFGMAWSTVSYIMSWTVRANSRDFLGMQLSLESNGLESGLKEEEKPK